MARIAFIGAGSFGFTRTLVKDILTFPLFEDATIVLMDINKERLDFIRRAVQLIIDKGNYLNLSPNSNNQPVPLHMTANSAVIGI